MIPSLIDNLGPWSWIVLGLVLMGLELLAPGAFLLWLGFAAMLTGLLDWWLGLSWQAALLVFAALSVAAVLAGRAMTRDREAEDGTRPPLNRRAQSLVGCVFTLDAPIARRQRARPRRRFVVARRRAGRAGRRQRARRARRRRHAGGGGGLAPPASFRSDPQGRARNPRASAGRVTRSWVPGSHCVRAGMTNENYATPARRRSR